MILPILLLALLQTSVAPAQSAVSIIISQDEGQEAFKISTPNATYFYQTEAGAFSSIIDQEGNDWIAFRQGQDRYPASAATRSRGLPNLVYQSADNGVGHPGFRQCLSILVDETTIRTFSRSGKWQWSWQFSPQYATMTLERTDPDHPCWFLYEGPIAGRFAPHEQYWGNDKDGPLTEFPDYYRSGGVFDQWRWAYFGDSQVQRIFFVQHLTPDNLPDTMGYLGNTPDGINAPDGMVVFGFGRYQKASPLISRVPQLFRLGFLERAIRTPADHAELATILGD